MARGYIGMSIENGDRSEATRESRRRFLRSGLVAAPLLMTLAARPAHAQEIVTGSLGTSTAGSSIDDVEFEPLGADDNDAFGAL
jgi:hypothetical protein